ncbi:MULTISPECIES: ATP-binding protein [Isoptericola]|uniref:Signal transduction histidine-protein kinase/phosphatase MprB n=1 Tax=Isoptericola sediminis TaxID=2733572 RepID=A0A849K6Q0_9MICO|nr:MULTISPECIES: ATP-binding protein [unclassified Isoptericola]MDO8144103.1 ATP-binding protein [Isoptericola sp. 178]MDO8147954.1 ATP-binding protein [Isoptericola sp. b515]MDO8152679.1 ATP-binding protein [Isoptericola sp. b408]NNU28120.1 sensor histidine kinase [Isoptericola sediminis]
MRRRVLQATISALAVAVLLLGVPLGIFGARYVVAGAEQRISDRVDAFTLTVSRAVERDERPTDDQLQRAAEGREGDLPARVTVSLPGGEQLTYGDEASDPVIVKARQTESGRAWVSFEVSASGAYIQAAQMVALVVVAGVVAIAAGVAMAVWQANRLSAPLVYLAASAEQLGSGQVRPSLEPSGVEEIDLVAAELARSGDRLAGRLAAERQFTQDASHQLRTPLTALSMRLEEIMLTSRDEEVVDEARVSLEQVERLVTVVDDLLATSRRSQGGTTEAVVLLDVVRQQHEEWADTFAGAGRELVIDVAEDHRVLATPGALAQVIATLLENSLKYGDGTTTIRSKPSGPKNAVALEVSDQGPGVDDEIAPRIFERGASTGGSTGLGLALARDLVAADGGRLELAQRRPPVFRIFLAGVPRTLDPRVVLPPGTTISSRGRRRGWLHHEEG